MINGYPDNASIYPGQTIQFHVSTDAPQFEIQIYRQAATLDLITTVGPYAGNFAGDHAYNQDWGVTALNNGVTAAGWSVYPFEIPEAFVSGVYIAMLIELDQNGAAPASILDTGTTYSPSAKLLFVVKNTAPGYSSQLLYKVPYFTYQAYNYVGGSSLYQQGNPVVLNRPGGGTGGEPWDALTGDASLFNTPYGNFDPFDNYLADPVKGSPRQTFEHWDAKFISYLESQGYRIDYCTDMDVHLDKDASLLGRYSLVLSVGHDEYYTDEMRNNLENYVAAGGNLAFFSGNTCYWHLYFPNNDLLTIHRDFEWGNPANPTYGFPLRPENSLTGVAFLNAGERNADGAPGSNASTNLKQVGYTVQHSDRWPFESTGLKDGDTFGAGQGLIGYECDGAPFDSQTAKPYRPDFSQNTPASFSILGYADTSSFNDKLGNHYATMGMYQENGTVFTAATTDWPRVAWEGETNTGQITRNVIDRLGGNPKGLKDLSEFNDMVCCDGFFSDDDNFRHAIVGTADGTISEIFFSPDEGQGQTVLIEQPGLQDLGAFYTANDAQRRVVILTASSELSELSYNPDTGQLVLPLGTIEGAQRVCGFFSTDDGLRHAIVSTLGGGIWEIFYDAQGQGRTQVGSYDGIVDIGCFFSRDDNYRHVIVGTTDGNLSELYYHPNFGISDVSIGNVPGLRKVSAYYRESDRYFSRRVQVLDSNDRLYEFRYSSEAGMIRCLLISGADCADIGGFFSSDDEYGHSIIADNSGMVKELFYPR